MSLPTAAAATTNESADVDTALSKLSAWLTDAVSEDTDKRTAATIQLQQFQRSASTVFWLMKLMTRPSVPPDTVLAAAIQLKNAVRTRWNEPDESDDDDNDDDTDDDSTDDKKSSGKSAFVGLSESDRRCIRQNLIGLQLSSSSTAVRRQIGEAIVIVAGTEPDERWPTFWQELRSRLAATDAWTTDPNEETKLAVTLEIVSAVLQTITSAGLDETTTATDDSDAESPTNQIRAAASEIGDPLITILLETARRLAAMPAPAHVVPSLASNDWPAGPSARSLLRVLQLTTYSLCTLNTLELADCTENRLGDIFPPLAALFAMPPVPSGSVLPTTGNGWTASAFSVMDDLRCAVCDFGTLFGSYYPADFAPFVGAFTKTVWFTVVGTNPSLSDDVAASAIAYLTVALGRGASPILSNNDDQPTDDAKQKAATMALTGRAAPLVGWSVGILDVQSIGSVVDSLVVPQLLRRATIMANDGRTDSKTADVADTELDNLSKAADIADELGGADVDSKRGMIMDFLRTLRVAHPVATAGAAAIAVKRLLADNNWLSTDAATALLLSFCVRGWSTPSIKTKLTAADDPGVSAFIRDVVVGQLTSADVNQQPSLKADCIRFVCGFRMHLSIDDAKTVCIELGRFLQADDVRTRSVAAVALDRLLTMAGRSDRIDAAVPTMLSALESLAAGRKSSDPAEFGTDGKPVFRGAGFAVRRSAYSAALRIVHTASKPAIGGGDPALLLRRLSGHLFLPACGSNDSLCALLDGLVRSLTPLSSAAPAAVESALLPTLLSVVRDEDLSESHSSVLDVLTAMLDSAPAVSSTFVSLYPNWLNPVWYTKRGRQAALARLLSTYVRKMPAVVWSTDAAKPLLGVFQKLLAANATSAAAMKLLTAADECLPPTELWSTHGPTIVRLLFTRLATADSHTIRFAKTMLRFILSTGNRRGFNTVVAAADRLQAGLLTKSLREQLLPALSPIEDRKTETDDGLDRSIDVGLLSTVLTRFTEPDGDANSSPFAAGRSALLAMPLADMATPVWSESAAIWLHALAAALRLLSKPSVLHTAALLTAGDKLATGLHALSAVHPGRLGPIFAKSLSPVERRSLMDLLDRCKLTID